MGREWELSRLGMSLIFVAFSAPVAAATAFLIYPIGQEASLYAFRLEHSTSC
jgi:hypothetical protein